MPDIHQQKRNNGGNDRIYHDGMHALLAVLILCLSGMGLNTATASDAEEKPNFVIVFVDDLGFRDISSYGSGVIDTPHIDRMAEEGIRFTNFYAQNVCGPSRAALMTGSYPIRVGEPDNKKNTQTIPHPEEITLAELLNRGGYTTGLIGKWHLAGHGEGEQGPGTGPYPEELMPNAQGFDYFFGTPAHNGFTRKPAPDRWKTELHRNGNVLERNTSMDTLTKKETEEAVRFIRRNKEDPFFLYLSYNMVHVILGASDQFRGTSDRGLYGDAVREIDHGVGRVMNELKKHGLDQETIVLFASDNGPWVENHLRDHGGDAYPFRGFKMSTWEGGVRVPGIVRWPGRIEAGQVSDEIVTTLDIYPTFAHLAGVDLPENRTIDGKDMTEFWLDKRETSPRETFYYYSWTDLQAVRRGRWKLVLPRPRRPKWLSWYARMTDEVNGHELYDLKNDSAELNDVSDENPEVVEELKQLAQEARQELGDYDVVGEGARYFDPNPPEPGSSRSYESGHEAKPVYTKLSTGSEPATVRNKPILEHVPGVSRRDPSDVIHHDDRYYVWYTRVTDEEPGYPSGYHGSVWYATSPDGQEWTEQGRVLDSGTSGNWDASGVFSPNILKWEERFYLFYSGAPELFSNDWKEDKAISPTCIGVAVSDSPEGPWMRLENNPVLEPSTDQPKTFDSLRVDDASLLVRNGEVKLYYRGRSRADGRDGRSSTQMGLATAPEPGGPYERNGSNPLLQTQDVMVWPQSYGVGIIRMTGGTRQFHYAYDGVQFVERNPVHQPPEAAGVYRVDQFRNHFIAPIPQWGIGQSPREGDVVLERFDIMYSRSPSSDD